jgi:hypothetical protein
LDKNGLFRFRFTVAALLFFLYLVIPTKNYYWDGVLFAYKIENAANWVALFNPNHLLYNVVGWTAFHAMGQSFRALYVLQGLNALVAAVAAFVLLGLLFRIELSRWAALSLTLLFSFTGTWWRFATDADAYVLSTTLLLICAGQLMPDRRPNPMIAAVTFASALLIHQLAIFFLPAAVFAIWIQQPRIKQRQWDPVRSVAKFVLISGTITLGVYAAAFVTLSASQPVTFLAWITTHASDAHFSFSLFRNTVISLRNWIQLFFVGRPSLVDYSSPISWILIAICIIALVSWIRALRRTGTWRLHIYRLPLFRFSLVWGTGYAIFLLFWLPNNTFYKLFALPAIILGLASCTPSKALSSRPSALPVFVLFLASFNLVFGVIPYSRLSANSAVEFAMHLSGVMPPGTVVYYSIFNTDDWLACYFNPQTRWEVLPPKAVVDNHLKNGTTIWLDTTAIENLSKTVPDWLQKRTLNTDRRELVTEKYHIQFWRLSPVFQALSCKVHAHEKVWENGSESPPERLGFTG